MIIIKISSLPSSLLLPLSISTGQEMSVLYIYIYIWDLNYVITEPADVLAPNSVRPSASTMIIKLEQFSPKFPWLS